MRKTVKISYTKERVVLSDVLPYEVPLIFSNRYFYRFLKNWDKILNIKDEKEQREKGLEKSVVYNELKKILFPSIKLSRPFQFKIKHKKDDYRILSIIHPSNQKEVVDFYNNNYPLILYYSSISPFSIRKPSKLADFIYFNDILHEKSSDNSLEYATVDEHDNEFENLKSFFSYKKYSNIYKFYESYQFHRSEKKFNELYKTDISKCFDSIYTHSISWALLNKNIVKENIEESKKTFPGSFDKLMQSLNFNETNGIIIGPEFSRIFSELILQQIDKDVYDKLLRKHKLYHRRDYEVFRYVDDFFIFYNDIETKNIIIRELRLSLKEYNLHLNEQKSKTYKKPIITEISIAKQKISDLFNTHLNLLIEKKKTKGKEGSEAVESKDLKFISSNVITRFKTIIKESDVAYKDIMNYSLAVLDNKISSLIKEWNKLENKDKKNEKIFLNGFIEILDISFFLYSVNPRVNFTIKISRILNKIIDFLKKDKSNDYTEPFSSYNKEVIFKKVYDEIYLVLQKNKSDDITPIESLYLLIALTQLGKSYRLPPEKLCSYFNIDWNNNGEVNIKNELNYFSIVVLLFYIKNIKIYEPIISELKEHILNKFKDAKRYDWRENTELVLLLMDILSCPFLNEDSTGAIDKVKEAISEGHSEDRIKRRRNEERKIRYNFKFKLLSLLGIDNGINLIEEEKFWFVKWTNFDYRMELQAKKSQEVY